MSCKITCPYCFQTMNDDEVLFRSERVHKNADEFISNKYGYDDLEDFKNRYEENDKNMVVYEAEFFAEQEDEQYADFWQKFGGTTEYNPDDKELNGRSYLRPIINPNDVTHQNFLKRQSDGSFLINDVEGMAAYVELVSGEKCRQRVCKHCHNPLPENYGKHDVKFIVIVGITNSGKTVYLYQLLSNISEYTAKINIATMPTSPSVKKFLQDNRVADNNPLPAPTSTRFQQPLFFDITQNVGADRLERHTCVFYDVPGEAFKSNNNVDKYAPFLEYADGVIMLLDPMQFKIFNSVSKNAEERDDTVTVINNIHSIIMHGQTSLKSHLPFAVCLSKVDNQYVKDVMNPDLYNRILQEVSGIKDDSGKYLAKFNDIEYSLIANQLKEFVQKNEINLYTQMDINYSCYAYFAFTALGCDVVEQISDNGVKVSVPVGPVLSMRIEEPLLWLFKQYGYIGSTEKNMKELIMGKQDGEENTLHDVMESASNAVGVLGNTFNNMLKKNPFRQKK